MVGSLSSGPAHRFDMSKSQQMRWPRRGTDRLLQIHSAVHNGALGTGFGQRFCPANDLLPRVAAAAWPPISRRFLHLVAGATQPAASEAGRIARHRGIR